ncbi:hypothetical protein ACVXG9_15175 [Escherichia coli]
MRKNVSKHRGLMKKILLISMSLGKGDYGGGIVSNTNFFALKELEHYELFSVGIVKTPTMHQTLLTWFCLAMRVNSQLQLIIY